MAPHGLIHGADDLRALGKPGAVDVVQGELRLPQHRAAQAVPQYVPGEDGAARPHKRDLFHRKILSSQFRRERSSLPAALIIPSPPQITTRKAAQSPPLPFGGSCQSHRKKSPSPGGRGSSASFLNYREAPPFLPVTGTGWPGAATSTRPGLTTWAFSRSGSPLKGAKSGASTQPQCHRSRGVSG